MTILVGGTICLAYTLWELIQLAIKAQDQVCLARQGAIGCERVTLRFNRQESSPLRLSARTR